MEPLTIAAWVWGAIATLGAFGAVWAKFRTSSDETTAKLWKEEAEAWKAKANRLEEMYSSLEKRVDHLENENRMLRELHDNKSEIAALRADVAQGFADLRVALTEGNV
jgi:FtsZ-binding cell division protein ZapB